MNKSVSLYIPCYNAEKTISECLEGALAQIYPLEEIIVIDDGSTDDTLLIAKQYPVRTISLNKNYGLGYVRNVALLEIKSEFVASLDADCVPDKDWLKNLLEEFDNHQDKMVVGVGGKLIESQKNSLADSWRSKHRPQHWGETLAVNPPYLSGSNTVFRREIIVELGQYSLQYQTNYEDVDLSQRSIYCGYRLIYTPKAQVNHLRKDSFWSLIKANQKKHYYCEYNSSNTLKRFFLKCKINFLQFNKDIKVDIRDRSVLGFSISLVIFAINALSDFILFIKQKNNQVVTEI